MELTREGLVDCVGWVELELALAHAGRAESEGVGSVHCSYTSLAAASSCSRSTSPLKPGSSSRSHSNKPSHKRSSN